MADGLKAIAGGSSETPRRWSRGGDLDGARGGGGRRDVVRFRNEQQAPALSAPEHCATTTESERTRGGRLTRCSR